jgi:PhnB protein
MKSINPYLNFPGNTEEAFQFYRSVFGGEFAGMVRFRDFGGNSAGVAEADLDKIAHAALPLGSANMIMAMDSLDSGPRKFQQGNNVYIVIETESQAETDRLFGALADGGEIEMPPQKTEWAERYGVCIDRYGVQWMLNYTGDVRFSARE